MPCLRFAGCGGYVLKNVGAIYSLYDQTSCPEQESRSITYIQVHHLPINRAGCGGAGIGGCYFYSCSSQINYPAQAFSFEIPCGLGGGVDF